MIEHGTRVYGRLKLTHPLVKSSPSYNRIPEVMKLRENIISNFLRNNQPVENYCKRDKEIE